MTAPEDPNPVQPEVAQQTKYDTDGSIFEGDEVLSPSCSDEAIVINLGSVERSPVNPSAGGAAAFPEPLPILVSSPAKRPGRKPKNPNRNKNLAFIGHIVAGRIIALDRAADAEGIPLDQRLFLGRTVAACRSDLERVQALGGIALAAFADLSRGTPLSVDDAHEPSGAIKEKAAVSVFGRWLMLDGAPGMTTRRGKPMDRLGVLKLVTAAAHGRVRAGRLEVERKQAPGSLHLTDAQLVADVHAVVGEEMAVGAVKSLRRSAIFALESFLDQGRGTRTREDLSPLLALVLASLGEAVAPKAMATMGASRAVAASLHPGHGFRLAARYSDRVQAELYRRCPVTDLTGPQVSYLPGAPGSGAPSVYRPEISHEDYAIVALFDRIELSVTTRRQRSWRWVKGAIDTAAGINSFVEERSKILATSVSPTDDHGLYSILIQEPTPQQLRAVIVALEAALSIVGEPEIHLLEMSIDFRVRGQGLSPAELLSQREKMVTILHRHHQHWLDPEKLPQRSDRRQSTMSGTSKITRPLHEHRRESVMPMSLQDMRRRDTVDYILATQPEEIFLNATVYDGLREAELQVSLQHKIGDKRDPRKKIVEDLPDTERRARMEVALWDQTLQDTFGIRTLADLTRQNLRKIRREHLSLFLPVFSEDPAAFAVEVERFARGGVHVLDLYQRAAAREARTRAGTGKHGQLVAWTEMNELTAAEIDRLARTWERF